MGLGVVVCGVLHLSIGLSMGIDKSKGVSGSWSVCHIFFFSRSERCGFGRTGWVDKISSIFVLLIVLWLFEESGVRLLAEALRTHAVIT